MQKSLEPSLEKKLIKKYGTLKDSHRVSELDISETIKELSYLTHSYFRYYGKFPSKLASFFLSKYASKESVLLDNYAGSGTGLVEASILNIPSYGIDINPLAVLASNVKTRKYDSLQLRKAWNELAEHIEKIRVEGHDCSRFIPEWNLIDKWFDKDIVKELSIIKAAIAGFQFKTSQDQEFFWLAFSAIIRRVSNAYDGEVRPHVNPNKRKREPIAAFAKKITEMINLAEVFSETVKDQVISKSYLQTNIELTKNSEIKKAGINLVLSHPPYLNCFDYIPVFSLELRWTEDIQSIWGGFDLKAVQKMETKSWPATNEKVLYGYFDGLREAYSQVFDVLEPGGICGVVIGDSTIRGELIRVHKIVGGILESIGFKLEEIVYRTTHYSTGKYSYRSRADYHGAHEPKRDGIVVMRKPK